MKRFSRNRSAFQALAGSLFAGMIYLTGTLTEVQDNKVLFKTPKGNFLLPKSLVVSQIKTQLGQALGHKTILRVPQNDLKTFRTR